MATPHAEAQAIAMRLCQLLEPAVAEIVIAGSLRRGKAEVKDIELVACLRDDCELRIAESALDSMLLRLLMDKTLAMDPLVKRNGKRYKRFVLPGSPQGRIIGSGPLAKAVKEAVAEVSPPVVELFIAERSNFGNILAIRTGDAEFTQKMVTPRGMGGLMPYQMHHAHGYLWRRSADGSGNETRIDCPTEEAFFAALGVPTLPPKERDAAGIRKLRNLLATPPLTLPKTEDDSDLVHWAR